MLKKYAAALLLVLASAQAFAQKNRAQKASGDNSTDDDSEMQTLIENMLQDSDSEDFSFDTQFEYLEGYATNPIDLNTASAKSLEDFGMLSELQVQGLVNYRREVGQIFSVYELLNVPSWDRVTVLKVLPYVTLSATKVKEPFSFAKAFKYSRSVLFARYQRIVEEQKGYTPLAEGSTAQRYLGSPDRIYSRYRLTYKDRMSIGLTMEKDAGEEFFKGSNKKGFDFYSAHFYLKDLNKNVAAVVVGDFQIYMGQGLLMWAGFGMRKSPAALNIKRIASPIRAYTSANEAQFMRGAATTLQFGKRNQWEVTPFVSYRGRDANISAIDTLDGELFETDIAEVSSLQNFGFHRTSNEIADRNALKIFSTGATVKYRGENWHIASNTVFNRLSAPLNRGNDPYQQFFFQGQQLLNTSLDYSYNYKNFQFFGETALSDNGGIATSNGLLANLDPKLNFAMLYRHYNRNYQHIFGNSFGERMGVNNETGFYMGLEAMPMAGLKISGYVDMYKFPWLTSTADAPSQGVEGFLRAEYNITRRWNFYTQLRTETKTTNGNSTTGYFHTSTPNTRTSWRLHGNFAASDVLEFRTRLELSWYKDSDNTKGSVFYQDVIWRPKFAPFEAQARLALFDTDDYDTRIYAYENDVLYSFSVPAYYGRGMRWYLNMSYDVNRDLTIWLRIAQTYYNDRDVISSGLSEIQGNTRTDVRVQVRYEF